MGFWSQYKHFLDEIRMNYMTDVISRISNAYPIEAKAVERMVVKTEKYITEHNNVAENQKQIILSLFSYLGDKLQILNNKDSINIYKWLREEEISYTQVGNANTNIIIIEKDDDLITFKLKWL